MAENLTEQDLKSARGEFYNIQLVKCYRSMGYYGVKVQPYEVFRTAYIYAGSYVWNWQLRRLVEREDHLLLDEVLGRLYRIGWRATVYPPRFDDVCFTYTGYDEESDSDDSV